MFQREDPAFVRRVFLQPQALHGGQPAGLWSITRAAAKGCTAGSAGGGTGPARVGWHAAGHETRAAGCFAVGSQGLNGGFPRATRTVERLAETNQRKNRENSPKP